MIGSIGPMVHGTSAKKKWIATVGTFCLAAVCASFATGWLLGLLGCFVQDVVSFNLRLAATLVLALLYGLQELGLVHLPRPQRRWQVPSGWRATMPQWKVGLAYGAILGTGVATYIETSAFYALVAICIGFLDPLRASICMSFYGLAEASAILWATANPSWESAHKRGCLLLGYKTRVHYLNGVALLAVSVALCAVLSS